MVQQAHRSGPDPAAIGARPIPEFDDVHDVWPRGERLTAVRRAAAAYKARSTARGQVHAVVKERTLAEPCRRDPHGLQTLPSTETAPWKRFWPVVPTYAHGGIAYGEIRGGRR
ncbi:hypothetical protein ACWDY7_27920 [Streptomyces calvus]|uniref:Uncharacterized protein n=1 Tax=Streptomyces calvus TaxID=67282 RepID=A0AA40SE30_9ACTN|nr:hypothetical protein [Streptomyces calvus]MBA8944476.1 hypothetical protein [Streptomyces calvus]GGP55945.1 hypothetical protein GCM10010247_30850 [Streptomyces calvus]